MLLKISDSLMVRTIGDPHLGRDFSRGTPLNRKGERSQSQFEQLERELMMDDCDVNIMMGDIFDKFIVAPTIVKRTYDIYMKAAITNPHITYILIRGNHDVSRDVKLKSSFDLLKHMLMGVSNIIVVDESYTYTTSDWSDTILICGYSAFKTAEEIIMDYEQDSFSAVFGHWDVESFGGDDSNLCPYKLLSTMTKLIVTGHIHTPDKRIIEPECGLQTQYPSETTVDLIITGSMQPYTHAEDPTGDLYVTTTIDEYLKDPTLYKDKCLRLIRKPGEELPTDIDCLQFTYKIETEKTSEQELQVTLGDFNFKELFMSCMDDNDVDEENKLKTWNKYVEVSGDVEED